MLTTPRCVVTALTAGFVALSSGNWSGALYLTVGSSVLVQRAAALERRDGPNGTLAWVVGLPGTAPAYDPVFDVADPLVMAVDSARSIVAVRRNSRVVFLSFADGGTISTVDFNAYENLCSESTTTDTSLFGFTSRQHLLYSQGNCLYRFDAANPTNVVAYQANADTASPFYSSTSFTRNFGEITAADGTPLYLVALTTGAVAALNANTLQQVWYSWMSAVVLSTGVYTFEVSFDSTVAYGLTSGGEVAASYMPTGAKMWRVPISGDLTYVPRPLVFDGSLFIATDTRVLRIRSEPTVIGSRVQWTTSLGSGSGTCYLAGSITKRSVPIGTPHGTVIVITKCSVAALNKDVGTVIWQRGTYFATAACTTVRVMGDYVLATCGSVAVLNVFTGDVITIFTRSSAIPRASFIESAIAPGSPAGVLFPATMAEVSNPVVVAYALNLPQLVTPPPSPFATPAPYPTLPPGFVPANATAPTMGPQPAPTFNTLPQVAVATRALIGSVNGLVGLHAGVLYLTIANNIAARDAISGATLWSTPLSASIIACLFDDNPFSPLVIMNASTQRLQLIVGCDTGIDSYAGDDGAWMWSYSVPSGLLLNVGLMQYDPTTDTICMTAQNNSVTNTIVCANGARVYTLQSQYNAGGSCSKWMIEMFKTFGNGTVTIEALCDENHARTLSVQSIAANNVIGAGVITPSVPPRQMALTWAASGPYVALAVQPLTAQPYANVQVLNGVTGVVVATLNGLALGEVGLSGVAITVATNMTDSTPYLLVSLFDGSSLTVLNYQVSLAAPQVLSGLPPISTFTMPSTAKYSSNVAYSTISQANGAPLLYFTATDFNPPSPTVSFVVAMDVVAGTAALNFSSTGAIVAQDAPPGHTLDDPALPVMTYVSTTGLVSFFNMSTGLYVGGFDAKYPNFLLPAYTPAIVTRGGTQWLVSPSSGFLATAFPLAQLASMGAWMARGNNQASAVPVDLGLTTDAATFIVAAVPSVFALDVTTGAAVWTASVPQFSGSAPLTMVGDFISVPTELGLMILDARTGNVTDVHRFAPCLLGAAAPNILSALDNRLLYSGGGGCLYLATVDVVNGTVSSVQASQWTSLATSITLLPTVAVFIDATSTVTGFDPVTLAKLWSYQLPFDVTSWAPMVYANGRYVVIVTTGTSVTILDSGTGSLVRTVTLAQHTLVGGTALSGIIDNKLYALSDTHIVAINVDPFANSSAASFAWTSTLASGGLFANDNDIVVATPSGALVASWEGGFGAFSRATGALLWQMTLPTPSLYVQNEYVIDNGDGAVTVRDAMSGGILAVLAVNGGNDIVSSGPALLVRGAANDPTTERILSIGANEGETTVFVTSALFRKPASTAAPVPTQTGPQSSIIGHSTAAPTLPWTLAPGEQLPPLGCVAAVRDAVPAFVACVNRDVITAQLHLPLAGIDCTPVGAAFQRCVVLYTNAMIETGCGAGVGFLAQHLLPAANASASLPLCRPAGGSACATGDFCAALAVPSNSSLATAQQLPPGYAVYPSGAIPAFAPVPLTTTTTAAPTTTTTTTITTTVAPNTTTAVPNTTQPRLQLPQRHPQRQRQPWHPQRQQRPLRCHRQRRPQCLPLRRRRRCRHRLPHPRQQRPRRQQRQHRCLPPRQPPRRQRPATSTTTTPSTTTTTPAPTTPPPSTASISSTPAPITTNPTTGTSTSPPMPTSTLTPPPPTATTGSPPSTPAPPSGPLSPTLVAQYAADASLPSQAQLEAMLSQQLFSGRQAVTIVIVAEQYTAPKSITFAFAGANPMGVYNTAMDMGDARLAASIGAQSLAAASSPPAAPSDAKPTGLVVGISILGALLVAMGVVAVLLIARVRRLQRQAAGSGLGGLNALASTSIQSTNELRTVHGGSTRDPTALYASLLDEEDKM
jgi:hypothetical protein